MFCQVNICATQQNTGLVNIPLYSVNNLTRHLQIEGRGLHYLN